MGRSGAWGTKHCEGLLDTAQAQRRSFCPDEWLSFRALGRRVISRFSAALSCLDAGAGLVDFGDLQRYTGLSREQLWAGLRALNTAEPPYQILQGRVVPGVSERARRELGTWPATDSLVDALAAAFAQAADAEKEPEKKQRLRAIADGLGGALRDIAVGVISKRLGEL
jgi:hypothetical protein